MWPIRCKNGKRIEIETNNIRKNLLKKRTFVELHLLPLRMIAITNFVNR
jgi:hypothetical protein